MSPHSPRSGTNSDARGLCRKLEEIGRDMVSMTTQEGFSRFLDNPENAQGVNRLVEDIRYALVDYQVCTPKDSLSSYLISSSDFATTRDVRQELSTDRESRSLAARSPVVTCE